jgi:hypothetical protein
MNVCRSATSREARAKSPPEVVASPTSCPAAILESSASRGVPKRTAAKAQSNRPMRWKRCSQARMCREQPNAPDRGTRDTRHRNPDFFSVSSGVVATWTAFLAHRELSATWRLACASPIGCLTLDMGLAWVRAPRATPHRPTDRGRRADGAPLGETCTFIVSRDGERDSRAPT